jgi:hypothetical protein
MVIAEWREVGFGNWKSEIDNASDPLNLIRLAPSKGETVNLDRSILVDQVERFFIFASLSQRKVQVVPD